MCEEVLYSDVAGLEEIGRLRYDVWESEGDIATQLFTDRTWLDAMDKEDTARHWLIRSDGQVVASARLTLHHEQDDYRDVALWRSKGIPITRYPVCDLGRLVVRADHRRKGYAKALIDCRIQAARDWGANAILCTASPLTVPVLKSRGFVEIGHTAVFEDRPNTVFHGLHLSLSTGNED